MKILNLMESTVYYDHDEGRRLFLNLTRSREVVGFGNSATSLKPMECWYKGEARLVAEVLPELRSSGRRCMFLIRICRKVYRFRRVKDYATTFIRLDDDNWMPGVRASSWAESVVLDVKEKFGV